RGGALPGRPALLELPDLRLAEVDDRHLRAGEQPSDEHEEEHEAEVQERCPVHGATLPAARTPSQSSGSSSSHTARRLSAPGRPSRCEVRVSTASWAGSTSRNWP